MIHPFSFPLLVRDLDDGEELAEELCEFTFKLRDRDRDGGLIGDAFGQTAKSAEDYAKHGYTSFVNYNLATLGALPRLHQAACSLFEEYFASCNQTGEFYIDTSWASTYDEGCFVPEHTHPNSHLSMVFYGQADEGSGEIVFRNPARHVYNQLSEASAAMWNDYVPIPAKRGRMIVFPSFMPHSTKPHKGSEERVIFSSNAILVNSMISRVKPEVEDAHRSARNRALRDDIGGLIPDNV